MTKRLFDLTGAIIATLLFSPIILGVATIMFVSGDRPILYVSERMKNLNEGFSLYKFRTMLPPASDENNAGVSGADKANRITRLGHVLRKYRLDELPQLINIIKGDMSLVGPRPPLRYYTEMFPDIYEKVLKDRPGVTGLASMIFHRHEESILQNASTPEETDDLYQRRCIPRKARIDLIYSRNRSICYDTAILFQTAIRIIRP